MTHHWCIYPIIKEPSYPNRLLLSIHSLSVASLTKGNTLNTLSPYNLLLLLNTKNLNNLLFLRFLTPKASLQKHKV
jgi:hypothetical protein